MHLSEDHDFLTNLLGNSSANAPNLDGSALVNLLDSINAGTQTCSFDRLASEGPSTSANKQTTSDAQALINQTILQQLSAIGERLNKIEQKSVKRHQGIINLVTKVLGQKPPTSSDSPSVHSQVITLVERTHKCQIHIQYQVSLPFPRLII